jgi:hypothetical protein
MLSTLNRVFSKVRCNLKFQENKVAQGVLSRSPYNHSCWTTSSPSNRLCRTMGSPSTCLPVSSLVVHLCPCVEGGKLLAEGLHALSML